MAVSGHQDNKYHACYSMWHSSSYCMRHSWPTNFGVKYALEPARCVTIVCSHVPTLVKWRASLGRAQKTKLTISVKNPHVVYHICSTSCIVCQKSLPGIKYVHTNSRQKNIFFHPPRTCFIYPTIQQYTTSNIMNIFIQVPRTRHFYTCNSSHTYVATYVVTR